jgi:hypothetical protein
MGKGVTIQGVGVLYTMDRGFDMPWVGGLKYHTPYPWYFDPPTDGIKKHISMVFYTLYP